MSSPIYTCKRCGKILYSSDAIQYSRKVEDGNLHVCKGCAPYYAEQIREYRAEQEYWVQKGREERLAKELKGERSRGGCVLAPIIVVVISVLIFILSGTGK